MVSSFTLVAPEDEQTHATVEEFFEHTLDRIDEYLDADGVEDLQRYRSAVDRLEEGQFAIYVRILTDVAKHVDDTSLTAIWRTHAEDGDVVRSPIALARAVRTLEDARWDVRADERNDWREEKRLDEMVALLDFAIERGYGVAYP